MHRDWHLMLWSATAAALAGAAYHGLVPGSDVGWAVVGVLVVVMLSYLLAGSVHDTLGPGRATPFMVVRTTGLGAYVVLVIIGHGELTALLLCESLTMATILVLWTRAARRRNPRAPGIVAAILLSGLAGIAFALPESVAQSTGLDPASLSHLAQIPAMVVLFVALAGPEPLRPRIPSFDRRVRAAATAVLWPRTSGRLRVRGPVP